VKKREDLKDVIREEVAGAGSGPSILTRSKNRPKEEMQYCIFRRGTREDLRALLKAWGYSREEIEAALNEYDAALEQQSF
jgi:hypothetical protein